MMKYYHIYVDCSLVLLYVDLGFISLRVRETIMLRCNPTALCHSIKTTILSLYFPFEVVPTAWVELESNQQKN